MGLTTWQVVLSSSIGFLIGFIASHIAVKRILNKRNYAYLDLTGLRAEMDKNAETYKKYVLGDWDK